MDEVMELRMVEEMALQLEEVTASRLDLELVTAMLVQMLDYQDLATDELMASLRVAEMGLELASMMVEEMASSSALQTVLVTASY